MLDIASSKEPFGYAERLFLHACSRQVSAYRTQGKTALPYITPEAPTFRI